MLQTAASATSANSSSKILFEQVSKMLHAKRLVVNLRFVGHQLTSSYGVFVLQYLLNATFISGTVGILSNQRQKFSRRITLAWFAMTPRDQMKAYESEMMAWGYWYAWSLSIICITVIMCVLIPGTLPAATLLFTIRYYIDRYNLDNGIYELGSESSGAFAGDVVNYLRVIMASWWFFMGCFFLVCDKEGRDLGVKSTFVTTWGAYSLIVAGLLLTVTSYLVRTYTFWWRKMYSNDKVESATSTTSLSTRDAAIRGSIVPAAWLGKLAAIFHLTPSCPPKQLDTEGTISWQVMENKDYIWPDDDVEGILELIRKQQQDGAPLPVDFNSRLSSAGIEISAVKHFLRDDRAQANLTDGREMESEIAFGSQPSEVEIEMSPMVPRTFEVSGHTARRASL